MAEYKSWWEIHEVKTGIFCRPSWWKWTVVQYEQYPSDPEPVVVNCRHFEGKDGAEQYLKLMRGEVDETDILQNMTEREVTDHDE